MDEQTKVKTYLVTGLSLIVLSFVSAFYLGRFHIISTILLISSFVFLILYFRLGLKLGKKLEQEENTKAHIRVLTTELERLETMFKNELITEDEYNAKKDSLKSQYSGEINTYISSK